MYGLGADDLTQMMGIGTLGEIAQGPDGNLYQWVQGVDGLGNPVGFWKRLRRLRRRLRPFMRRAMPMMRRAASMIPGAGPAVAAGMQTVSQMMPGAGAEGGEAGVSGFYGLGALYQAPDGGLYQMAGYGGFAGDEALDGLGSYTLGEIAQGPDGNLYQWVQGVDGLGNPFGFWRKLRSFLKRKIRPFVRRVLPIAKRFAPFIPGIGPAVAAGITAATPILKQAGVAGYDGLGALYQAPDGSLYQMAGYDGYDGDEALDGDEELGFFADDELRGYDGDEALEGDEELGYFADDELRGYDGDEALEGDEELGDMDGYLFDPSMSGVEGYVPDVPAGTRPFMAQTPETWRAIW